MSNKFDDEERVEAYARALIEAARSQGRANLDLVQWEHAKKFSPEVLATIAAMADDGDLDLIEQVNREYKELLDSQDTTVSVTVTTAVPMDEELRAKVLKRAQEEFQAPVYLIERVDPSILGGVIMEGRNKRFDASFKAQLTVIRRNLSGAFLGRDSND